MGTAALLMKTEKILSDVVEYLAQRGRHRIEIVGYSDGPAGPDLLNRRRVRVTRPISTPWERRRAAPLSST